MSFSMDMGITPGGPDDDIGLPHYDRSNQSNSQSSDYQHHSQSSDDEKHDDAYMSPPDSSSTSQSHNETKQQLQCFACLRMNDPNLMYPHKFIHPSYFADIRTYQRSLCISCYQCMGMDQSVNQANSHLIHQCDWTVDGMDNHYAQCSGCGGPNRKNNTCETCPSIFCDACIRSFGGPKLWWKVEKVDYWKCLSHERSPEFLKDCDLFTVPHVRCRLERGEFTTTTAINPMPYSSHRLSSNESKQMKSLLMVAGLTYHTPLVKRKLAYHVHDVANLASHLRENIIQTLKTESAASLKNLKSIPDASSSPITFSKPLKLISVSLYHKTACRPDEHRRYLVGLMENLQTFTTVWPGWTVRIYYDASMLLPAASPLEDQDAIDPRDRVIETENGTLTIASNPSEFVWDHSKYTAHLISAWQTFMSWARDQPHIQLCYFNWPHLQDSEGFHLRHVGMLARFLALADIGVSATHVIMADLDNIWTNKARDKAENFEPAEARFHRFYDWSYPWNLGGGMFSVRWPETELKPENPEEAPFHDIEYAIHEFAQAHFSAPHEFYKQYRPGIVASCRSIGKSKKRKGKKGSKNSKQVKKSPYNGRMIIDGDFAIAELTHTDELDGRMEDELFGYCVDQAFLDRWVWVRMKQFDSAVHAPGWIATTPTRVKNVPQLPTVPEKTKIMQNQNPFMNFFDMLTQSRWPACYHLESFPQYKSDDSLSWQCPTLDNWMKRKCKDISMKQSKTEWKTTPFEAKDASSPLHYISYVVDSRVRMVNSLIEYLGRLTHNSYTPNHAANQRLSHHPFIGLPSLSSSLVQDHHSKRSRRTDEYGVPPKNRKHDWAIQLIHKFMEDQRRGVQRKIFMQQSINAKIFGSFELDHERNTASSSSNQPVFDPASSYSQSLQQSNMQSYSDESLPKYQPNGFTNSGEHAGYQAYNRVDDDDQPVNPRIRRRSRASAAHAAKRTKQAHVVNLVDETEWADDHWSIFSYHQPSNSLNCVEYVIDLTDEQDRILFEFV